MLIKIFTFGFDEIKGVFDDAELSVFMQANQIVSVRDYLVTKGGQPFLTLVVTYQPFENEEVTERKKKPDESWKESLTEADMGLFSMLREWRGKTSKKEGLPPYILFTNKQLAEIAKNKPQSNNDLLAIDGIGNSKVKKYGETILSMTQVDLGNDGTEDKQQGESASK